MILIPLNLSKRFDVLTKRGFHDFTPNHGLAQAAGQGCPPPVRFTQTQIQTRIQVQMQVQLQIQV